MAEQCRLALSPGYLEARLTVPRAQVNPVGQREVLVDGSPSWRLDARRWEARARVSPESQARDAATRLRRGSLSVIPDCDHLPHVECPGSFVAALDRFLS